LPKNIDGNGLSISKLRGKHFVLFSNWIPGCIYKFQTIFGSDSFYFAKHCFSFLTILLGTWLENIDVN